MDLRRFARLSMSHSGNPAGLPWAIENFGLWLIGVCVDFVPFASAVFEIDSTGGDNDCVVFTSYSEKGSDALVRLARADVLDSAEVAIAHVCNRTVRRCFLMRDDAVSGKRLLPRQTG